MIIYNGKNSLNDFDLYVASKDLPPAQLKEITEKVPHKSGLWDFSFANNPEGDYEPVTLKYTFDVIDDCKRDLNAQKKAINKWLHSRGDQKLYDTDISTTDYYEVYNVKAGWSEEGLQGLVTVEFLCYPFIKSEKQAKFTLTTEVQSVTLNNEGSRKINPSIRVMSKNLFDISKIETTPISDTYPYISEIGENYIDITVGEAYNGNGHIAIPIKLKEVCPQMVAGKSYFISANSGAWNKCIYLKQLDYFWNFGNALTITEEMLECTLGLYGYATYRGQSAGTCRISNIQIEEGTTATPYEPFVNATATINDGVNSYSLSAGEYADVLTLKADENTLNISGEGIIYIDYTEESY